MKEKYKYLEVIKTYNFGLSVVTKKDFKKGEVVFKYDEGVLTNEQTLYSLQIRPNLYLEHPIAGFVQHSCDPNCWVSNTTLQFICKKNIKVGDMIQMDYEQTEDILFQSFVCKCGSPICRGLISGRLVLDK